MPKESVKKIIAILMIIGLNWSWISAVGETLAYYFDNEGGSDNTFTAGTLDFSLAPGSWSAYPIDPIGLLLGDSVSKTITVNNSGSLGFKYNVIAVKTSGSDNFCNALDISATLDGNPITGGNLIGWTSTTSIYSSLSDIWVFNISLPSSENSYPLESCGFKFLFTGWQEELANSSFGFSDIEEDGNTLMGAAGQACSPQAVSLPSSFDITTWENHAKEGGTVEGSFVFPSSAPALELGPTYIKGNLTFNDNDVTIKGPIYIHGNLTIGAGTTITQHNSFGNNFTAIIVDGTITIGDNVLFNGSGTTGAFLLVSKAPAGSDVINVLAGTVPTGNIGDAVLFATNGNIHIGANRTVLDAFVVTTASSGSLGPNNAGTGADVSGVGTVTWSYPNYITTVGLPYATVALQPSYNSHYLQATNYGFALSPGATITGITVDINRTGQQNLGYGIQDYHVYLVKSGVIQTGTDKAVSGVWPTSLTPQSYVFSGSGWTPTDINNTNFGAVLSAHGGGILSTFTATVDYIKITVNYSIAGQTITNEGSPLPAHPNLSIPTEVICGPVFATQDKVVINEFVPNVTDTTFTTDSGEKSPTANGSTVVWTNPDGAHEENGTNTSDNTNGKQQYSDFGFNVPTGALITGIEAKADAWYTSTTPTMTNTGWKPPTSYDGVFSISNPDHAYTSNDSYAIANSGGEYASYKNFGFPTIPTGATINGIEVSIEAHRNSSSSRTFDVSLSSDAGSNFTSTKNTGDFGTSDTTRSTGNSADIWGRSWSSSDFTNTNFRVKIAATSGGNNIYLDYFQVIVYYTSAAATCSLGMDLSYNNGTDWTPTTEKNTTLTNTEATYTLGGPGDTWSHTWTSTEINSSFRARVHDICQTGATAHLDWLRFKVYFSVTGDQGTVGGNNGEWMELYNPTSVAVDVTGWTLRDAASGTLPITTANSVNPTNPGTLNIASHKYLVVYRNGNMDFDLDNISDTLSLYDAGSNYKDSHSYNMPAGVPENKSFARIPDGVNNWVDPDPTPGEPNNMFVVPYVEEVEIVESFDLAQDLLGEEEVVEETPIPSAESEATEQAIEENQEEEMITGINNTIGGIINGIFGGNILDEEVVQESATEETIIEETPAPLIEDEATKQATEKTAIEEEVIIEIIPVLSADNGTPGQAAEMITNEEAVIEEQIAIPENIEGDNSLGNNPITVDTNTTASDLTDTVPIE